MYLKFIGGTFELFRKYLQLLTILEGRSELFAEKLLKKV